MTLHLTPRFLVAVLACCESFKPHSDQTTNRRFFPSLSSSTVQYHAWQWFSTLLEGNPSDWELDSNSNSNQWPVLVVEESGQLDSKHLPLALRQLDEETSAKRLKEMDIFCVHFVYQSAVMFYIAKHLSSSPHYQISPDKVPEWEARIHRCNETADKEVAIEILDAKEGRGENHFMTVWHGMVGLAALFASLDWWRVITDIVFVECRTHGFRPTTGIMIVWMLAALATRINTEQDTPLGFLLPTFTKLPHGKA